MKIRQGYELVEIMNEWMVVPIGENMIKVDGLFSLSESSAFLWKQLRVEHSIDDLLTSFLAEYEIDRRTAELDITEFVGNLDRIGLLEGMENTGK